MSKLRGMAELARSGSNASSRSMPKAMERRTSALDAIISLPGIVKINVEGAYIVDDECSTPNSALNHDTQYETRTIRLPNHEGIVNHVALDIGGSLAKLVYFSREQDSGYLGGTLNFLTFETSSITQLFDFVKKLATGQQRSIGDSPVRPRVGATGGGAYKYYNDMKRVLGADIFREDEMECLIMGLNFFITEIPREVFTYSEKDPMPFEQTRTSTYPYLLVNIGSGVSMIKVLGVQQYERIGGTSLGGGTLWGLLSLLTGARTFEDMLAMADRGDNTAVDMLVGDIYGTDYGKIGLKSTTIASSFGKVFKMKRQGESDAEDGNVGHNEVGDNVGSHPDAERAFAPEDISRSLLYAISNNIGQIAYLQCEKHKLEHIYFGGSFIRGHRQTMSTLSYAIRFWSNGSKKAYFLRHEAFLGAMGLFLKGDGTSTSDS